MHVNRRPMVLLEHVGRDPVVGHDRSSLVPWSLSLSRILLLSRSRLLSLASCSSATRHLSATRRNTSSHGEVLELHWLRSSRDRRPNRRSRSRSPSPSRRNPTGVGCFTSARHGQQLSQDVLRGGPGRRGRGCGGRGARWSSRLVLRRQLPFQAGEATRAPERSEPSSWWRIDIIISIISIDIDIDIIVGWWWWRRRHRRRYREPGARRGTSHGRDDEVWLLWVWVWVWLWVWVLWIDRCDVVGVGVGGWGRDDDGWNDPGTLGIDRGTLHG